MIDKNLFINDKQELAIKEILKERVRQFNKWGDQDHSMEIWLAILTEEVGEFAECVLDNKFGGKHKENLQAELTQVAAVALQILEKLV